MAPLTPEDGNAVLRAFGGTPRRAGAKTDLVRECESSAVATLLLSGWACTVMTLPDGRRQIAGFVLPGDICHPEALAIPRDYAVTAITACTYVHVDKAALDGIARKHAAVGLALETHRHVAEAISRNWILNLGQRNAFERIGHLFCELFVRLSRVGLTDGTSYHFPVTQIDLAEATGLTAVHVNRTLQELRARGLLHLENRSLTILDYPRLANLAMFDGSYLSPNVHVNGH